MIKKTIHITTANEQDFCNKILEAVKIMQEDKLKVEIQYQPVSTRDEYHYVVYTALLIVRKNEYGL